MPDIIKIKKGTKDNLPNLHVGELGYAYDTNEVYIGSYEGNKKPNDIVILTDTNGVKYRLSVNTDGSLTAVPI